MNRFDLEVDANGADKRRRERVIRVAKQKRRFTNRTVSNDEQFEHVVEVLVCCVCEPFAIASHLAFSIGPLQLPLVANKISRARTKLLKFLQQSANMVKHCMLGLYKNCMQCTQSCINRRSKTAKN